MYEGAQLAETMLAIHAAEMGQAERCPDWRRADRMERHIMIYRRGNRAVCWLGCLLERTGRRLREYGMPRTMPRGSSVPQRS